MKGFHKTLLWFSALIFINLLFGPLVRATDSGLACPDWPLCFGQYIPEFDFNIWMEHGHRIVSGIIGLILLYITYRIFTDSTLKKQFLGMALAAAVLIIIQIILGMLTVTELLHPTTVNSHLLNAMLFFAVIVTMTVKAGYLAEGKSSFATGVTISHQSNWLLYANMAAVFLQLILGGRVSSNYAGLACGSEFPTCYGEWVPEMFGTITIHMHHRFGGYLLLLVSAFTAFYLTKNKGPKKVRFYAHMTFGLVFIQFFVGYFNILFHLPKLVTALHTGVAVLVFINAWLTILHNNIHLSEKAS